MPDSLQLHKTRRVSTTTDPSLPSTAPKNINDGEHKDLQVPKRKFINHFYDRSRREFCGRTFKGWACIISYSIIYLIFLSTYTLIFLYLSLVFIKQMVKFNNFEPMRLMYPEASIGLTAIPTSEYSYPLIWYRHGRKGDYDKYAQAIDRLLLSNKNTSIRDNLGPCGRYPYGYDQNPCIIIKVNKQFYWTGKPLQLNSTETKLAPIEVKNWIKNDNNRIWLQCDGYHSYDKEHIGSIKYYPNPPGLDPDLFPLSSDNDSPLVAMEITNFTKGISLTIECKLWYEKGPSSVEFVLYVVPADRFALSLDIYDNVKV